MIVLPELVTPRTRVRLMKGPDTQALLRYRTENREHLAPWEPLRDAAYYTPEHCARTIADGREAARLDRGYPLAVFDADESEIFATITFANVMRGPFQACLLGYGAASRAQGQGLMHEALQAALGWAFGGLDLHRVMANHLPINERSARLLARLGFEREGYAKSYLRIAGVWQDHVLMAKTRPGD